jgi:mono/diheme cytochrome c family protein
MLAASVWLVAAVGLSPDATRGRQVFEQGKTADGVSIEAVVGADVTVPGLACATCHGADGRGRPEGAVRPADVRWSALSRPAVTSAERTRPVYDDAALTVAIALGVGAGGRPLDRVMPRYRLTAADMRDLVAYLHALGEQPEPGVRDDAVTIGVLVPEGAAGPPLRAAVRAWADELNGRGGVFARRIELRELLATAAALAALPEDEQPFAFLGGAAVDPQDAVGAWTRAAEIPLVRARGLMSERRDSADERVFELGSSLGDEVRALVQSVSERPLSLFVWPVERQPLMAELCRAPSCRLVSRVEDAQAVLPLERAFPRSLARGRRVLLPSALAADLVADISGEADALDVAAHVVPEDVSADAARRYALPAGSRIEQWSALASARVLEEGLVRSGRELSRAGLVRALATLRDFDTGFGPTVTLGRGGHVAHAEVRVLSWSEGRFRRVAR